MLDDGLRGDDLDGRPCVLLLCGAFNPPHRGHEQALVDSLNCLKNKFVDIAAVLICLMDDSYVRSKVRSREEPRTFFTPEKHRRELCFLAFRGVPSARVLPWTAAGWRVARKKVEAEMPDAQVVLVCGAEKSRARAKTGPVFFAQRRYASTDLRELALQNKLESADERIHRNVVDYIAQNSLFVTFDLTLEESLDFVRRISDDVVPKFKAFVEQEWERTGVPGNTTVVTIEGGSEAVRIRVTAEVYRFFEGKVSHCRILSNKDAVAPDLFSEICRVQDVELQAHCYNILNHLMCEKFCGYDVVVLDSWWPSTFVLHPFALIVAKDSRMKFPSWPQSLPKPAKCVLMYIPSQTKDDNGSLLLQRIPGMVFVPNDGDSLKQTMESVLPETSFRLEPNALEEQWNDRAVEVGEPVARRQKQRVCCRRWYLLAESEEDALCMCTIFYVILSLFVCSIAMVIAVVLTSKWSWPIILVPITCFLLVLMIFLGNRNGKSQDRVLVSNDGLIIRRFSRFSVQTLERIKLEDVSRVFFRMSRTQVMKRHREGPATFLYYRYRIWLVIQLKNPAVITIFIGNREMRPRDQDMLRRLKQMIKDSQKPYHGFVVEQANNDDDASCSAGDDSGVEIADAGEDDEMVVEDGGCEDGGWSGDDYSAGGSGGGS